MVLVHFCFLLLLIHHFILLLLIHYFLLLLPVHFSCFVLLLIHFFFLLPPERDENLLHTHKCLGPQEAPVVPGARSKPLRHSQEPLP